MPSKEIKELRKAGNLEEALNLAQTELQAEPDNIWPKRNISWVYYDYLKQNTAPEHFDDFLSWLTKIADLNLPEEEKMLFDHLCWQIGSIVFKTFNSGFAHYGKMIQLLGITQSFSYTRPSEGYSFLFKAFHKALKDTDAYLQFAEWWDFDNFRPEDYQKEKLLDGKEVMALAEQAYIAFAKHVLPKRQPDGSVIFDKTRVETFLPKLEELGNKYPSYQYPAYFQAKLLLSQGDRENMLSALIPFARKKRNDFWVWEILSEAYLNDEEKVFALYCKALSCHSPEEMLINLRQKMAGLLIKRQLYNEAKTEIDLLVASRNSSGFRIPQNVSDWQSQEWYKNASALKNNKNLYDQYKHFADGILFADIPEVTVIVDFINSDKKILNFIASETSFGFFKYERFLKDVSIGDTLKVRFQSGTPGGLFLVYTVSKFADEDFRQQYYKQVEGLVRISDGKPFGFLDDVFIHPSMVTKYKLTDGTALKATAIKTFNEAKKQWGWKLVDVLLQQ
jgi:hypothetical protein